METLAGGEDDFPRPRLQGTGHLASPELDLLLDVIFGSAEENFLDRTLVAQDVFRQRWSLIGTLRLAADQDDATVEAFLAKRFDGTSAGQSRSDDDIRFRCCHDLPCLPEFGLGT